LDITQTAGGARLLRSLITNPIKDNVQLQRRLNSIDTYLNDEVMERVKEGIIYREEKSKHIHQLLSHVRDIPKLVSVILYKKIIPNTFVKLRSTLRIFFENKFLLDELAYLGLNETTQSYLQHLYNSLEQMLKNDDEYKDDIDFIRDGYQSNIDELRKIAYHSDELLIQYQQELAQAAGIPNVKVKFVLNQ
jgi:DNA mismatch repair protein MutS